MLNDGTSLDNRHRLALPYWARPGIRLMAKPADSITAGPDVDDEEDDEDEEDEEDEGDPDEGKSEDELRAELKRIRQSLKTANGQSKSKREKLKTLRAELDAARKPKKKADDDDDDDIESIREQARREGQKAGDDRVKGAAIREALAAAGVSDEKARGRLARMVDLDELDLNDDGSVDGLDDAIDELKGDMPAMFTPPRRRRTSVAGDDDRDGQAGRKEQPKSASQKAADQLLGRGGGR